jgi:serine/threonine protein kinase
MVSTAADRNLLFGILALQMDFVNRDALIAGMHAWVLDKSRLLGEILVAQNALPPKRLALLDSLVDEHLEQHGQDPEKSLAALDSSAVVRHKLGQVEDAEVQASLARILGEGAPEAGFPVGTTAFQPTPAESRFVILRPHAKGGLGEVFVARDEELHREVALKEIQSQYSHDPVSRGRFLLEAEITGNLEHPSIVPVYGFGTYADGRPYFAMRFIRGESLKEALRRFHQAEHGSPGLRAVELRKLLSSFLAVCQAVAFAHSRGVLNRDIKDDNIMLGKFGETLVLDWGLAKPVDRLQQEAGVSLANVPLLPAATSGSVETLAGSTVGTPGYMSPEQAAGRLDLMGPTSDVFSLGATLYCVLTGKAPFTGKDAVEVLRQVQRGDYPRPRKLNSNIPRALEAICLKALALEPRHRYPSARDLAEDLEHWLADQPVKAYPEPWTKRLARWSRRHRALVTGAAALLVTTVLALAVSLFFINQERRDKATAYQFAEEQRLRAEANFRQARQAVDIYFTQVSEDQLLHEPGMQPLREKLLKSALNYYQAFEKQRGDDPTLQKELAFAYLRWGTIAGELGSRKEAKEILKKAVAGFEQLQTTHAGDAEVQSGLGQSYVTLAYLQVFSDQVAEGEPLARKAAAVLDKLHKENPTVSEYARLLGRSHDLLGISLALTGKPREAEAAMLQAIAVLQQATKISAQDAEARRLLALAYNNLGQTYYLLGEQGKRERALERAVANYEELVDENKTSARLRKDLARSLTNLGNLYYDFGRLARAEKLLSRSLVLVEQLVRENPRVTEYAEMVAYASLRLGQVHAAQGRTAAARPLLKHAVAYYEKPAQEQADHLLDLSRSYFAMSRFLAEAGPPALALPACEAALAVRDKLAKDRLPRAEMLHAQEMLNWLQVQTGQSTAAVQIAAQLQLIQEREDLAAKAARNVERQLDVAFSYIRLAELHDHAGEPARALPALTQALGILDKITREHEDHYRAENLKALTYALQGRMLIQMKEPAEALQATTKAVDLTRKLVRADPAYCFALACHLAACLGPGKTDPVVEAQYAAAAVDALEKATAAGYDNVYQLENHPALAPLRGRADFKQLLEKTRSRLKKG